MLGIWPVYKTMAQLDLGLAGIIAAVSAFVGEGSQLVFGSLSDRGYRRHLIVIGLLLSSFAAFVAYTQNYFALMMLMLGLMIGSGMFHPSAVGLVGQMSRTRKALLIGFFVSGGGLGMAFSQIAFAKAVEWFGGHTFILILPTVLLIGFFFLPYFYLPAAVQTAKRSQLSYIMDSFRLFRRPELATLYVAQLFNQTIFWGLIFLLPDILLTREYDTWITFGGGHMAYIIGASLSMIPGGYLADKYSPKTVLYGSNILGAILIYTLLLSPNLENEMVMALLFSIGAVTGVVNPVIVAWGNRLAPESPGTVSAFLMGLVWCVAEGLGPGGGGLMTKLFIDDAPAKAVGILGLCFIITLAATYRMPDDEKEAVPESIAIQ